MRYSKEEPPFNVEQAFDLNSVLEEFHRLGCQELNKLLKDSESFTIQHCTEKGSLIQIDMKRLSWYLPVHLIAVFLSPGGDEIRLQYLLRGFRLLHSFSELASRHTKLEQILIEDVRVTEQILDLVFYMLVLLARYEKESHVTIFVPLLHSSLVACSVHLLTGYISSQWKDLVRVLLAHPKGSELTSSRPKNWLNNQKVRLARAARDARAPSEGENTFLDKSGGSGQGNYYDSPESPSDEFYVPSTTRRGSNQGTLKFGVTLRTGSNETSEIATPDFGETTPQQGMQMNCTSLRYVHCEPGQYVSLLDTEGKVVAKGKVYQAEGRWLGNSLDELGTCVVDVLELKVDRWKRGPHPSEAAGTTFHEAEAKNGVMRVAWDAKSIISA